MRHLLKKCIVLLCAVEAAILVEIGIESLVGAYRDGIAFHELARDRDAFCSGVYRLNGGEFIWIKVKRSFHLISFIFNLPDDDCYIVDGKGSAVKRVSTGIRLKGQGDRLFPWEDSISEDGFCSGIYSIRDFANISVFRRSNGYQQKFLCVGTALNILACLTGFVLLWRKGNRLTGSDSNAANLR